MKFKKKKKVWVASFTIWFLCGQGKLSMLSQFFGLGHRFLERSHITGGGGVQKLTPSNSFWTHSKRDRGVSGSTSVTSWDVITALVLNIQPAMLTQGQPHQSEPTKRCEHFTSDSRILYVVNYSVFNHTQHSLRLTQKYNGLITRNSFFLSFF